MSYVKHVWQDDDYFTPEQANEMSAALEAVDNRDYFEVGVEGQELPSDRLPINGIFYKFIRLDETYHSYQVMKKISPTTVVDLPLDAFTIRGRDLVAEFDALDVEALSQLKDTVNEIISGHITVGGAYSIVTADRINSKATFIWRTTGGDESLTSGEAQLKIIGGNCSIPHNVPRSLVVTPELTAYTVSVVVATFVTQISDDGTYEFSYNNGWLYNDNSISLTDYGIFVSALPYNNGDIITVTLSDGAITQATYSRANAIVLANIDIWEEAITESGTYYFTYNEGWFYNGEPIDLSTYGIAVADNYGFSQGDSLVCVYTKQFYDVIKCASPTQFRSIGLNAFDKNEMVLENRTISNGHIVEAEGKYLGYCRMVGGLDNGYVVYSQSAAVRNIWVTPELPAEGVEVSTEGVEFSATLSVVHSDVDTYIVFEAVEFDDICIHPQWSGIMNTTYEEHFDSIVDLPTTSIDGILLPIGQGYFPSVYDKRDYIDVVNKKYHKWINRIIYNETNLQSVIAMGVPYIYDLSFIYYQLDTPLVYDVEIDGNYIAGDFGTEKWKGTEYGVYTEMSYISNLVDKLRTDVLTLSKQELSEHQRQQVWENLGLYDLTEEEF